MTEALSNHREPRWYSGGNQEYRPLFDEDTEFFKRALYESAAIESTPKSVAGPLYKDFTNILKKVDECITELNPAYTAEYIIPVGYQSRETARIVRQLPIEERQALTRVNEYKIRLLQQVPYSEKGKELYCQALPSGMLSIPPYARQGEFGDYSERSRKACASACFRMIFGGITGHVPSQQAVLAGLEGQHGTAVVDDAIYAGIYKTRAFKEIYDKNVVMAEIIGTDFTTINKLTARIKEKQPGSEVYCTINLASQTAGDKVWHTSVLLEAGAGTVTYHDPSASSGGAYCRANTRSFLNRWAVAYNRAVLTIAA